MQDRTGIPATVFKTLARSVVLLVLVGAVSLAYAARDNAPATTSATYYTHGIDLKIDSKAWRGEEFLPRSSWHLKNLVPGWHQFFALEDVKPGDYGRNVISMHVKKTKAWMCLDFKNLVEDDNGQNEPEQSEDGNGSTDGELGDTLELFAWFDDGDGDWEAGEEPLFGTSTQKASELLDEKTYRLADTTGGEAFKSWQTRYIGIFWCAGDLVVDTADASLTCDGSSVGNAPQTDTLAVDVEFLAVPSSRDSFVCGEDDGDNDDKPSKPRKPWWWGHWWSWNWSWNWGWH